MTNVNTLRKLKMILKIITILTAILLLESAWLNKGSQTPTVSCVSDGQPVNSTSLTNIVGIMKDYVNGESAFDYLSYIYLGWRTTGGPWHNYIIQNFLVEKLEAGGYTFSSTDMSAIKDKDYIWIQHDDANYDSGLLVWAPQYASLTVISGGNQQLIDQVNVEVYAFDPNCEIYRSYYKKTLGIQSLDGMSRWITQKDNNGNRINVDNGLESTLNQRTHLTTTSCFTDPAGTKVNEAKGVVGELIYIGSVSSSEVAGNIVYYGSLTGIEGNANLKGKVLFSDSSNANNFKLAKQVGAVAVMTTWALEKFNTPTINGVVWNSDAAKYAGGATTPDTLAQMQTGSPIVEWNLSLDQKTALQQLMRQASNEGKSVRIKSVAIGDIYSMAYKNQGLGQLTAIAEIAGTTKAQERIIYVAHINEPGACDNASGAGLQLELALKLKDMIDKGIIARPERTITFIWGNETTCSKLWLNAHPDQNSHVIGAIDLDMVGENPEKTGGIFRIEKTPDPSADFKYTFDVLPGHAPYTDNNTFVRLPDSHTLLGTGDVPELSGSYLNDLLMASAQEVTRSVDSGFKVAFNPYKGGSDHKAYVQYGIPAVLAWHFTDYVYHSTADTLDKVSAQELADVGIATISAGYLAASAGEDQALGLMEIVYNAAVERFTLEARNTVNHFNWDMKKGNDTRYTLSTEIGILNAWGTWYAQAIRSCGSSFVGEGGSSNYKSSETEYIAKINKLLENAKGLAYQEADKYRN